MGEIWKEVFGGYLVPFSTLISIALDFQPILKDEERWNLS
jgi:hypothetical protein